MAKKKKTWLAVGGVALSALLTVGIVSSVFPAEEKCDHVFDEGKVVVAPTCSSEGKKVLTCSECGETAALSIPKDGHDFVFNGIDGAFCSVCEAALVSSSFAPFDETIYLDSGWYRWDLSLFDDDNSGDFFIGECVVTSGDAKDETFMVGTYYDDVNKVLKVSGDGAYDEDFNIFCEITCVSFVVNDFIYFYLDNRIDVVVESDDGSSFTGYLHDFYVYDSREVEFVR